VKVKPKVPGAIVRDPHTRKPLPPEGAEVPEESYWIRRLMDEDVVLVDEAPKAEQPKRVEAPEDDEHDERDR